MGYCVTIAVLAVVWGASRGVFQAGRAALQRADDSGAGSDSALFTCAGSWLVGLFMETVGHVAIAICSLLFVWSYRDNIGSQWVVLGLAIYGTAWLTMRSSEKLAVFAAACCGDVSPISALRWMAVVPAGILAAFAVALPIHWIVMINMGGWASEPTLIVEDSETLRSIESYLQALAGPLAFVYCGARTAPRQQFAAAVVLAILLLVGARVGAAWINASSYGLWIEFSPWRVFLQAIGAFGAAYVIWLQEAESSRATSARRG